MCVCKASKIVGPNFLGCNLLPYFPFLQLGFLLLFIPNYTEGGFRGIFQVYVEACSENFLEFSLVNLSDIILLLCSYYLHGGCWANKNQERRFSF